MKKILIVIMAMFVCFMGCATVQTKEVEDKISHLSFSNDGKKILFDRCREEGCQIQVYDLETGELAAYQSPQNERWTMARYSYDGKKIVFATIPKKDGYLDLIQQQIAVMDPDGKNVRKLTTGPFPKEYPTFSHSGKKVLYAKAAHMREHGVTPAGLYDAWEIDIDTGQETRLTDMKRFSMSNLYYYPDDETFVFEASGAFKMKKGDVTAQKLFPLAERVSPKHPMLSKDGTRLFFDAAWEHLVFYLYSPDGNNKRIGGGGSVNSAAISPDGEYLGISYGTTINIYLVKDGRLQVQFYLLTATHMRNWDDDNRKYPRNQKMIPEMPSRIINRNE
jgi:Tol biopolymer transport system component